ncbi:MAG TPA: hypothetical protein DCP25_15555 [Chloroflexi bacterium]|nr:hypothetical protein [Chloroflexota bacterium]
MRPILEGVSTSETDARIEPLLSLAEGQRLLGLSRAGFHRLLGRGELQTVRIGYRVLIEPAALRRFIEAHRSLPLNDDDRASTRPFVRASAAGVGGDDPT